MRKLKGSDLSFIGVLLSVVGTLVAFYGTRVSSRETAAKNDKLLQLSTELNEKNDRLLQKSDESTAKSDALVSKSQEMARLSEENSRLSRELVAYATGGNSFFHLHVSDFGSPNNTARIRVVGKHPVHKTQLVIFDVTDQFEMVAAGSGQFDLTKATKKDVDVDIVFPEHKDKKLRIFPFESGPSRNDYAYFIHFTNSAGTFRQIIHLVKVGETWQQAYIVEKIEGEGDGRFVSLVQHFDADYPTRGARIVRK